MGIANTTLKMKNPTDPSRIFEGIFLVDTGAQYSVLPRRAWEQLGLKSQRTQKFSLADGTVIERPVGSAFVEFQGIESATPVVLGEEGDSAILGVVTLETLGLVMNPFTRELLPAHLML